MDKPSARYSSRPSTALASLRFARRALILSVLLAAVGFGQAQEGRRPVPSPHATFTCAVVDGRTQAPVADAEVRWYVTELPSATPFDLAEFLDTAGDFLVQDYANDETRAAPGGLVAHSDEHGVVAIAGPLASTTVIARSGSLWGCSDGWMEGAAEQHLVLFPDTDVIVHVRDVEGKPAPGVPIVIQYRSDSRDSIAPAVLRATSDREGTARLAHAGFGMASLMAMWNVKSADIAWSIAPQICATSPELELDRAALPTQPFELRLPALGEVELVVNDSDGRAAELELRPELMLAADLPDGVGTGTTRGWTGGSGPRARGETKEGRALFRNVGLGVELACKVQPNSASQTWVRRFQGPTKAGERVRVEMKLESDSPIFVGRLVDASKRPLAKVRVTTTLFSLPSASRTHFANLGNDATIAAVSGSLTTSAEGKFSLSYPSDAASGGVPLLVLCVSPNQPASLAQRFELGAQWSAGVHNLGDIVLAPTPIVASGKVVDAAGAPIAGVSLGISVFKGPPHIVATTDANGDFSLRSGEPYDELLLNASARGYLHAFVYARVGQHDLRIVLAGAGSFEGSFAFPPDTHFGEFHFHIERTVKGAWTHGEWEHNPAKGETFKMTDLEPGTYRLFARHGARELLARDDIVVRAGETTKLDPIDLVALFKEEHK